MYRLLEKKNSLAAKSVLQPKSVHPLSSLVVILKSPETEKVAVEQMFITKVE